MNPLASNQRGHPDAPAGRAPRRRRHRHGRRGICALRSWMYRHLPNACAFPPITWWCVARKNGAWAIRSRKASMIWTIYATRPKRSSPRTAVVGWKRTCGPWEIPPACRPSPTPLPSWPQSSHALALCAAPAGSTSPISVRDCLAGYAAGRRRAYAHRCAAAHTVHTMSWSPGPTAAPRRIPGIATIAIPEAYRLSNR